MTIDDATRPPWASPAARGSRNELTRRHNLSTVLLAVHYGTAVSRAELTRKTGLNRSTIGSMVAALAEAGLVTSEVAEDASGVGRPSPIVRPTTEVVALSIHPDIDAVRVALVGLGGRVLASERREVAGGLDMAEAVDIIAELTETVRRSAPKHTRIVGAGVAVPGLVDDERGIVVDAPHLGWRGEPLARRVAARLGIEVHVGNDATVGLLAEARFGAGRGRSDVLYLNGSASGIGGSALVGGTLLTGARGFGGEFGHILVTSDGLPCDCGRSGCLETEVNMQRLDAARAAGALDAELDRQADVLSHAIANLVVAFNPEAVILGGFLANVLDNRGAAIRNGVARLAFGPLAEGVVIARNALGDDLLLVGAAELGLARLLRNPLG